MTSCKEDNEYNTYINMNTTTSNHNDNKKRNNEYVGEYFVNDDTLIRRDSIIDDIDIDSDQKELDAERIEYIREKLKYDKIIEEVRAFATLKDNYDWINDDEDNKIGMKDKIVKETSVLELPEYTRNLIQSIPKSLILRPTLGKIGTGAKFNKEKELCGNPIQVYQQIVQPNHNQTPIEYMISVVEELMQLHSVGLLYNDLCEDNIVYGKLVDFGLISKINDYIPKWRPHIFPKDFSHGPCTIETDTHAVRVLLKDYLNIEVKEDFTLQEIYYMLKHHQRMDEYIQEKYYVNEVHNIHKWVLFDWQIICIFSFIFSFMITKENKFELGLGMFLYSSITFVNSILTYYTAKDRYDGISAIMQLILTFVDGTFYVNLFSGMAKDSQIHSIKLGIKVFAVLQQILIFIHFYHITVFNDNFDNILLKYKQEYNTFLRLRVNPECRVQMIKIPLRYYHNLKVLWWVILAIWQTSTVIWLILSFYFDKNLAVSFGILALSICCIGFSAARRSVYFAHDSFYSSGVFVQYFMAICFFIVFIVAITDKNNMNSLLVIFFQCVLSVSEILVLLGLIYTFAELTDFWSTIRALMKDLNLFKTDDSLQVDDQDKRN